MTGGAAVGRHHVAVVLAIVPNRSATVTFVAVISREQNMVRHWTKSRRAVRGGLVAGGTIASGGDLRMIPLGMH